MDVKDIPVTGRIRLATNVGHRAREQATWNKEGSQVLRGLDNKEGLFGLTKEFTPLEEGGAKLPPESKRVASNAYGLLREFVAKAASRWDTEATNDFGNTVAKADIVLDGNVLVKNCPPPFLLFLEQQITHVLAFLRNAVTIGDDAGWVFSEETDTWRADPVTTQRTEKATDYVVVREAQVIDGKAFEAIIRERDQQRLMGHWNTTAVSGALSPKQKRQLLEKGEILLAAVRSAREEANSKSVQVMVVSEPLLSWWTQGVI